MGWIKVEGDAYGDPRICDDCLRLWYEVDGDEERECWRADDGLLHLRRTTLLEESVAEAINALDGRLPTYCGLAVSA